MEAAAEVAERLGWSTVWTTDHVLVPTEDADDYGRIYEAILSLAWIGARFAKVRLGTSVIVVPVRNAVLLAKELATLDDLTDGRVVAGVGIGWNETEFANLGMADRFRVAGCVPRRDDRPVASPLVGIDRAVPWPVPRVRGCRVRSPAPPGRRAPHRRGRASRASLEARRTAG